jgi:hypothetical protein
MRRRLLTLAGAAVVLATLTACVGIPTSGGIRTGEVISDEVDTDLEFVPSGPVAGSTPTEILADFMEAARGPQDGYAIAQQFLTDSFAEVWDPEAGVVIRTGSASIEPGASEASLRYSVTSSAYVDADGRYFESPQATQTLDYSFEQEEGEWRISAAPPGTVLSAGSFNVVFAEHSLYYFDPSFDYLVPDVRWFPSRPTISVRVVRALLLGQSSWLTDGVLFTSFPTATVLGSPDSGSSVIIQSGTATVDLSVEALAASAADRDRMRQQLIATLGVPNVEMTVEGLPLDTPDASGGANVRPSVEGPVLVGTGDAFGFVTGDTITPLEGGLSEKVVGVGATAATLTNDKIEIVVLAGDGSAYLASQGVAPVTLIDERSGLAVPTIDPFRYIWSAQAASAASLTAFDTQGLEFALTTGLPADASVVSMDLSRDGTRLLLYLSTPVGPQLVVVGVVRGSANEPIRLGEPHPLLTPMGTPIDATWVDESTVATLSAVGASTPITVLEIGGPSSSLGQVEQGTAIVGGAGGTDGIRVLNAGEVWRPQGNRGWVDTGVVASFLATKQ